MNKKFLRTLVLIILSACISPTLYADSMPSNTIQADIELLNKQKILVHQILVSYVQIGQLQNYGNPINIRITSVSKFDENLNRLKKSAELSKQYKQMQTVWEQLKQIALAQPEKVSMRKLFELNEQIVMLADEMKSVLVVNDNSENQVETIAQQQIMLSQRIALFMLMKNWDTEAYAEKMNSSLNTYYHNIVILENNKNNTAKINKSISQSKKDFTTLMSIIYQYDNSHDYSHSISRYTAQLFRKAKKTYRLYSSLNNSSNKKKGSLYKANLHVATLNKSLSIQ